MRRIYWRGVSAAGACLILALLICGTDALAQAQDDLAALETKIDELNRAGSYDEALPLAERLVAGRQAKFGDLSAEHAEALNLLATLYFSQSRFDKAEPIYQRVWTIRESVLGAGHEELLSTLGMLASVYLSTGRPNLAEPLLKRVLSQREQATPPDREQIVYSLKQLASAASALKHHDEAEAHIRRALAMVEGADQVPAETAALLGALAEVQRGQGKQADAVTTLERALALHEKAAQSQDEDLLAQLNHIQALVQMAKLSQVMDRFDIAAQLIERVHALTEKALGPEHPAVASALEAIASVKEGQGRLADAEALRKRAIAIVERAYGRQHLNVAQSLEALGTLYRMQFRYDEALPLFQRSLDIAAPVLGPGNPDLSPYLADLGEQLWFLQRYDESEPHLTRALANVENSQAADATKSATMQIRVLRSLAYLREAQKRPSEAWPLLQRALELSERSFGPDHGVTGGMLAALGVHAFGEDRLDEAERLFLRALPISEKAGRDSSGYADIIAGLGLVHYKRRDWQKAYDAMSTASAIFAALEQKAAGSASVFAERSTGQDSVPRHQFYLLQATAAYHLAAADAAKSELLSDEGFKLIQRSQNSRTATALAQMAARFASGTGALSLLLRERQDLMRERRAVDTRLTLALSLPPEQRDTAGEAALREHLDRMSGRVGTIDAELVRDFSDYAGLADPKPLTIKTVQGLLTAREVLVIVASLPEQTLIWAIGRENAQLELVPVGSDQLGREVAALRCGLDTAAWETDGPESCKSLFGMTPAKSEPLPFDLARAHALYTTLFSHFKEHIDGKQLLFVAAGPLASLPLHVLVAEKPTQAIPRAGNGYVTAEWLAKRHAISVLPSVSSLASLRAVVKTSLAAKPLIGFGNPLLTGRNGRDRSAWARTSCRGERSQQSSRVVRSGVAGNLAGSFHGGLANTDFLRRQMPLPETADELCAVARVLAADDGDVNLGARATETAVKALNHAGLLATYKFVHFATHGLLAGETESVGSAAEPSLMLTPPETATEADDGLLTASEVAQLKLDAEWVVLSACNTAGGETNGAEALSGLARAFIYAGARALLVSHWYVDSDAAVKLVTKALEEWKRDPKIGRAEATRRAMIAAMRDPALVANWAPAGHPSVWAPFVLVGDGR